MINRGTVYAVYKREVTEWLTKYKGINWLIIIIKTWYRLI